MSNENEFREDERCPRILKYQNFEQEFIYQELVVSNSVNVSEESSSW